MLYNNHQKQEHRNNAVQCNMSYNVTRF